MGEDRDTDEAHLLLSEVVAELGPVAVMTALRDADDTIVDFRYDYVNPAFCRTVGEPAEALLGNRLLELYPSHVELGLFDAYCDVVYTGRSYVSELPWFDERNVQAYLEVRVTRFRDGYLMSGQDVTARTMAEQAQRLLGSAPADLAAADEAVEDERSEDEHPPGPDLSGEVEVWVRSTGRWAPGFRVERYLDDGRVLVRRTTDQHALSQSFPPEMLRPVRRPAHRRW